MQCNTSKSLAEFCSGANVYTLPLQGLCESQFRQCVSKQYFRLRRQKSKIQHDTEVGVGPGSESDSSVLYYQHSYFFLGHFTVSSILFPAV